MQNQSHKLASFEGLRGIAAFVVVLFHLHLAFYNDSAYAIRHSLAFLPWTPRVALCALIQGSYNGTFAVWIFWIMSAFVLSLQFFLRANEVGNTRAHDYLEDASLRRYPRLFIPVFASILFAYAICRLGFIHNTQLAQLFGEPYSEMDPKNWTTS